MQCRISRATIAIPFRIISRLALPARPSPYDIFGPNQAIQTRAHQSGKGGGAQNVARPNDSYIPLRTNRGIGIADIEHTFDHDRSLRRRVDQLRYAQAKLFTIVAATLPLSVRTGSPWRYRGMSSSVLRPRCAKAAGTPVNVIDRVTADQCIHLASGTLWSTYRRLRYDVNTRLEYEELRRRMRN